MNKGSVRTTTDLELFKQNSSYHDIFSKSEWLVFSVFFENSLVVMSNAVHKICALQRIPFY